MPKIAGIPRKEPMARIHISITESQMRRLNAICEMTGRRTSEVIGLLIDQAAKEED